MKFWPYDYFFVLSSMQTTAFQHFYFKGFPYGPVLIINPFLVVHPNLCHLRT